MGRLVGLLLFTLIFSLLFLFLSLLLFYSFISVAFSLPFSLVCIHFALDIRYAITGLWPLDSVFIPLEHISLMRKR